jgi:hypothetical protein
VRPRRTDLLRAAIALAALALAGAACQPATSPQPSLPASPVVGVIVAVDATNLTDVRGFTLRLVGGRTIDFKLGQLENPTDFPPGHLKEHQANSVSVRVFFRDDGGTPVVYRLEDAEGPSAT